MTNDAFIQKLIQYVENLAPPEIYWSEHWFEEVSTAKWVAEELIDDIMSHPMSPAEDIVEAFAFRMIMFRFQSTENKAKRIFSIAADSAHEWLEFFEMEKES